MSVEIVDVARENDNLKQSSLPDTGKPREALLWTVSYYHQELLCEPGPDDIELKIQ